MFKLGFAFVVLAACATDSSPQQRHVEWSLASPIDAAACTRIVVSAFVESGDTETIEAACAATAVELTWDPDNAPTRVEVDYRYWQIPFGCESQACWVERTMASGQTAFDANATTTTIIVEPIINLPF